MSESGVKYDTGKPRFSLLPWSAVRAVVDVLEYGARKYSVDNWKRVPDARQRYVDAALRHMTALADGERRDGESGLHHAAHAATCLLFIVWFDEKEDAANELSEVMRASKEHAMKINQPRSPMAERMIVQGADGARSVVEGWGGEDDGH